MDEIKKYDIEYLISFCKPYPELYNSVATKLYTRFGITGAPLALLITHFIITYGGKTNGK